MNHPKIQGYTDAASLVAAEYPGVEGQEGMKYSGSRKRPAGKRQAGTARINNIFCGLSLLLLLTGTARADAYVDALNAEVSKPVYIKQAEKEIQKISQQQLSRSAELEQDVSSAVGDMSGFVGLLQNKYPATYQVFLKLSKNKQQEIFQSFHETKELAETTKKILETYLR